jgi:hypothetical protein
MAEFYQHPLIILVFQIIYMKYFLIFIDELANF